MVCIHLGGDHGPVMLTFNLSTRYHRKFLENRIVSELPEFPRPLIRAFIKSVFKTRGGIFKAPFNFLDKRKLRQGLEMFQVKIIDHGALIPTGFSRNGFPPLEFAIDASSGALVKTNTSRTAPESKP